MAYRCYMTVTIRVENMEVKVKNAQITDGKFHENGNKTKELSKEAINVIEIKAGNSVMISACGRDSTAYGTQGSLELYDVSAGAQSSLGTFFWSSPYSGSNSFKWTPAAKTDDSDDQYAYGSAGGNFALHHDMLATVQAGLGDIYLACIKTY